MGQRKRELVSQFGFAGIHFSRTVAANASPFFGRLIFSVGLASMVGWVQPVGAADETTDSGLIEIVVTAQKYNSTVQNTPISISAVSGDQLAAAGIATVEELVHNLPGVSMKTAGPGQTEYEARGLASSGGAAPTVGFYLDEVPLSPPALAQVGKVVIDPDLYDINRIEVLRGPQGTLYGSGSMGGTIKIVTNQPKLDTYEGSVQGTLSDTQGGSGNGGGSFMLNVPLGNTLALRVVGTDTYRSGWVDRVVLNPFPPDTPVTNPPPYLRGNVLAAPVQSVAHDVNSEQLYSGRASLRFQPSDDFSVVAAALYQRIAMGGYDEFDSPPGPTYLAHYEASDIPESVADTVHIYSLTIADNLGFADLTSATAYWDRVLTQTQDASESFSLLNELPSYVAVPITETDPSRQFSQEIRLTSRGNDQLHWLVGAFYSDLNSIYQTYSANPVFSSPSNPTGIAYEGHNPYRVQQFALFADGSYKITDTLTLSAGLRWYRYLSQLSEQAWGADASYLTPQAPLKTEASDNGYNPRVNLSYSPNGDLTAYISASKGFRPGGANTRTAPPNIPPYCTEAAPPTFGPDSVWNYEVGEKAKMFDNWLTVNSDLYYIKWTGVQETLLLPCGSQYQANAGNGRSFGPELEVNAKLSANWSISASAAYTDAKITAPSSALATLVAGSIGSCPTVSNCTIPILNVPKDTASLAVVYTTNLARGYQLTARVADSYVGTTTDEAYYFGVQLPSYEIASARIGLSNDRWSATFFVDNLANKVALLTANNTSFQLNIPQLIRYSTNQPRTFGTQITYHF